MKTPVWKRLTVLLVIITVGPVLSTMVMAGEPPASDELTSRLARYYTDRAAVEAAYGIEEQCRMFQDMAAFVRSRAQVIECALENAGTDRNVAGMNRIVQRLFRSADVIGLSEEEGGASPNARHSIRAGAGEYLDRVTGHRYMKNPDGTYTEYNRKGEFFRIVPADQPHLAMNMDVVPITDVCYLLYGRNACNSSGRILALSPGEAHPEGWYLKNAVVSIDRIY